MRAQAFAVVTAAAFLVCPALADQPLPALPKIHPDIALSHPSIATQAKSVTAERATLRARHKTFRNACASVVAGTPQDSWCAAEDAALQSALEAHYDASEALIDAYEAAENVFVAGALVEYAQANGWSAADLKGIEDGIKNWRTYADYDAKKVNATWADIAARTGDAALTKSAARVKGFSSTGAGTQRSYNDCAIFAIASAAGVPYGAAAAVATKLIAEGKWRHPDERAKPQATIKSRGLMGGEVLMLAEYYGRASVITQDAFEATLAASRPVTVAVYPRNGTSQDGHQIVLTKAFRDGGTLWFQALDSNNGTLAKVFVRSDELTALIKETGIAYAPAQGRAIPPLR